MRFYYANPCVHLKPVFLDFHGEFQNCGSLHSGSYRDGSLHTESFHNVSKFIGLRDIQIRTFCNNLTFGLNRMIDQIQKKNPKKSKKVSLV